MIIYQNKVCPVCDRVVYIVSQAGINCRKWGGVICERHCKPCSYNQDWHCRFPKEAEKQKETYHQRLVREFKEKHQIKKDALQKQDINTAI